MLGALAINGALSIAGDFRAASLWAGHAIATDQNGSGGVAFQAANLDPSGYAFIFKQAADAGWRILWTADGQIHWGDGTGALDTLLNRAYANALQTGRRLHNEW